MDKSGKSDKSDSSEKSNINRILVNIFGGKYSLAHFPLALQVAANLMQEMSFYFKLNFSGEKLKELRS